MSLFHPKGPITLSMVLLVIMPVVSHAMLYGSTDVSATPPGPGSLPPPSASALAAAAAAYPGQTLSEAYPNAPIGAFGSPVDITGTPTLTNQTAVSPTNASVQVGGGGAGGGPGGGPPGGTGGGAPSISGNTSAVAKILGVDKLPSQAAPAAGVLVIPDPETIEDTKDLIIDKTINAIPKIYCACPYSVNHDGFECGVEAAYYKPGNWRLRCYPQDIRGQEYIFYRKTHD